MSGDNSEEFTHTDFMIFALLIVTIMLAFATMIAIGYLASGPDPGRFLAVFVAGGVTATAGMFTARYIQMTKKTLPTENELFDWKQRRHIRKRRAALLLEKAEVEIEHERDNIVHERILEASDPNKPPHATPWTHPENRMPPIDQSRRNQ